MITGHYQGLGLDCKAREIHHCPSVLLASDIEYTLKLLKEGLKGKECLS